MDNSSTPDEENNKKDTSVDPNIDPVKVESLNKEVDTTPHVIEPTPISEPIIKKSFFRPEVLLIPVLRRKLGKQARPVAILLIVLVLVVLGGVGTWLKFNRTSHNNFVASSFKFEVPVFKIVSTDPADNATNVNTATSLTLNFSQPVNPDKMINNMFITPTVNGTYKQGTNPDQIVFTPSTPFTPGTKFSVMINGTYQSNRGTQLGLPFMYSFSTSIPANGVVFQDQNGLIDQLTSLASGQKETYSLQVGSSVGQGVSVTLYKGNVEQLLNSLVYSNTTSDGYTSANFNDLSVSTSGLTKISTQSNLINNSSFSVQEPDGLYVAVATDSTGEEVGFVWIDFSNFGVLLKQDDQKVIFDAQQYSDSSEIPANVSFYNLDNTVDELGSVTANGLTTDNLAYTPSVDIAVATYKGEISIVPINILNSGGDIRVDQNLSTAQLAYGVTDKPTYKVGETIRFSGFVRNDNDAQYINPGSGVVNLYISSYKGGTHLANLTEPIDSHGMFSGNIQTQSSWMTAGDNFDQLQIFAASVSGNPNNDVPVTSFSLTNQSNSTNNISVSFSKNSYLPSDQITATIQATNSSGQAIANSPITVNVYSEDYYENNPSANYANFGYSGSPIKGSPVTLQLNSSGEATYTLNPASLPNDGNSQLVTVQANLPGQSQGVGAAGSATAIVHQGNGYITFGLTRQQIPKGSDLISDVYASELNGSSAPNVNLKYVLTDYTNSTTLSSGNVTTDSNGYARIDIPADQLSNTDSMKLTVTMVDQYGNPISAGTYASVVDSGNVNWDTSGAGLLNLNVSGSSSTVNVGEKLNLTITSPYNIKALVTLDRGRIYDPSIVNLNAGVNSYDISVTPQLAPSFYLTISYFNDGTYYSEGVNFNVNNNNQQSKLSVNASSSVTANQPITVNIVSTDNSGNPLPTNLIVDVVNSSTYNFNKNVNPDLYSTFYDPRPIMTSSSSSLSPIGSGGGRCGGGGGDLPSFANADGTVLYWNPELVTNTSGQASFSFTPSPGNWTISVYAMSDSSSVANQTVSLSAH